MSDLSILLAPLEGLLGFFQREHHHTDEEALHAEAQRQDALQAMYTALITTRKYTKRCRGPWKSLAIGSTRSSGQKDRLNRPVSTSKP